MQADEVDMGMTYDELSTFGICRKNLKLGSYSMFQRLAHEWRGKMKPSEVATKVKVSDFRKQHVYPRIRGPRPLRTVQE